MLGEVWREGGGVRPTTRREGKEEEGMQERRAMWEVMLDDIVK